MKLKTNPILPGADINLIRLLSEITLHVNGLTEGRMAAHHAAMTAAPTTGMYANGDVVLNATPTELGSAPNKYVITGWINVVSGSPGTFVAMRCLTGG